MKGCFGDVRVVAGGCLHCVCRVSRGMFVGYLGDVHVMSWWCMGGIWGMSWVCVERKSWFFGVFGVSRDDWGCLGTVWVSVSVS